MPRKKIKEEIVFTRCTLVGPDGKKRSGWEMWKGNVCLGKAGNKEELLCYYERLKGPVPSGHWKNYTWKTSSMPPRERGRHPREIERAAYA